jgi:hypothetical protein
MLERIGRGLGGGRRDKHLVRQNGINVAFSAKNSSKLVFIGGL